MRRRALVLGLVTLAGFAVVLPGAAGSAQAPPSRHHHHQHRHRSALTRDDAGTTVEAASPESRGGATDARRFDQSWVALAAAALLVGANRRRWMRATRPHWPAPLATRAPARAPPVDTAFAPAR
jgi:hypothetical protein